MESKEKASEWKGETGMEKETGTEKNLEKAADIFLDFGDITRLRCDCIVNAANKSLLGGGGVDGAIHRAAGPELLEECRRLCGCRTGEAKITKGYRLKAKYVIHTVGPVYAGKPSDGEQLSACYRNSLDLAKKNGIHSIAFPAISTGVYGYPLKEAVPVAYRTVTQWLAGQTDYGMRVVFCCFDRAAFDAYRSVAGDVERWKEDGE